MKLALLLVSLLVTLTAQSQDVEDIQVGEGADVSLKCPVEAMLSSRGKSSLDEPLDESYDAFEKFSTREKRAAQFLIVQWFKETARISKITASPRFRLNRLNNNVSLSIKSVEPSDSGEFKCKLIDGFGSVSHHFNLLVKGNLVKK